MYCKSYSDFFPEGHRCYMMPEMQLRQEDMSVEDKLISNIENANTFIFFDFECTQDNLVHCNIGYKSHVFGKCVHCLKSSCGSSEHKPNLCVVYKVCTLCAETQDECEKCGQREHVFSSENTLNDF